MAPRDYNEDLDDEEVGQAAQGQGDADEGHETDEGGQEGSEYASGDAGEEQAPAEREDVDERPSRGQNRFQRLSNRNAELERELAELRKREAPQQPAFRWPQIESDEAFNQRTQLMSPDERNEHRLARREQIQQLQFAQLSTQMQNMADKAAYDARAASSRTHARYASEVEREYQVQLNRGVVVPREEILRWIIGGKVLANSGSPEVKRAKEAGRRRVERQEAPAPRGRSDIQGGRRQLTEREARARRLENIEL